MEKGYGNGSHLSSIQWWQSWSKRTSGRLRSPWRTCWTRRITTQTARWSSPTSSRFWKLMVSRSVWQWQIFLKFIQLAVQNVSVARKHQQLNSKFDENSRKTYFLKVKLLPINLSLHEISKEFDLTLYLVSSKFGRGWIPLSQFCTTETMRIPDWLSRTFIIPFHFFSISAVPFRLIKWSGNSYFLFKTFENYFERKRMYIDFF